MPKARLPPMYVWCSHPSTDSSTGRMNCRCNMSSLEADSITSQRPRHLHGTSFQPFHYTILYNPIQQLGDVEAAHSKNEQSGRDAPEPREIPLVLLPRHPDVHSPQPGDDVHGQDDRAEDGELSEDIGRLLLSFVHADVDLR